jgi:hypothetical protein
VGQEPVFRERDRSPPRRHWGTDRGNRRRDASPPAPVDKLPAVRDLQAESDARLRFLFKAQAASIQDVANNLLKNHSVRLSHDLVIPAMDDYIRKAVLLADKLGIDDEPPFPAFQLGNEALSGNTDGAGRAASLGGTARLCSVLPDVPVPMAFQRLKLSLQIDQAGAIHAATREQELTALDQM